MRQLHRSRRLKQFHCDLCAVTHIADVFEIAVRLRDEFHECFVFVLLPSGVIEKFVEYDHRALDEARLCVAENGFGRAVEIAIDMQEADLTVGMGAQKVFERGLEETLDENNIVAGSVPCTSNAPVFALNVQPS